MKPSKKKTLKSKMKDIKKILFDPILERGEKIEEIKNNFCDAKNKIVISH